MTSTEAYIALNMIGKVGPVRLRHLLGYFENPESILKASSDQFLNDFAPELAELLVPPGVVVGQLVVGETQQIQPGDVDVADMMDALDRFGPDRVIDTPLSESGLVGLAVGLAISVTNKLSERVAFGLTVDITAKLCPCGTIP